MKEEQIKQKREALEMLKKMGIDKASRQEFEEKDTVYCIVEYAQYMRKVTEKEQELIDEFEKKTGLLVYFLVESCLPDGKELYVFLSAGHKLNAKLQKEQGYVCTYIEDMKIPALNKIQFYHIVIRGNGIIHLTEL